MDTPATPPDALSPLDLARFTAARLQLEVDELRLRELVRQHGETTADRAKHADAMNTLSRELRATYDLTDADAVNPETGAITRKG